ncbi:hypothetical protein [Thiomicrorhabdus aquaedulcis]|uniref:hypothetical protein n=1 Tax=Thiomicrorhabdus aquaedulcis TaxID=2211106 RepID=UPI000FDB5BAA|nr:hypothetical protein [Thiomicrorhabdus aquaedulcis]
MTTPVNNLSQKRLNARLKNRRIQLRKQSGFMVLLGMLMLVLGAAAWFGNVGNIRSETMQISMEKSHVNALKDIKDKMLMYAVMQPEIFRTASGATTALPVEQIPGPGYFPCPDTSGNGISNAPCGAGVSVVVGRVPSHISSRFFNFITRPVLQENYWFAVDSRFVVQNNDFNNFGAAGAFKSKRYAPLNSTEPATAALTLDGVTDVVMVLFYTGSALAGQDRSSNTVTAFLELENADGDADFISTSANPAQFNDHVIAITRDEWNSALLTRVSQDVNSDDIPDLCALPDDSAHWFNACNNIFKTASDGTLCAGVATDFDNQVGQNWRGVLGCP